MRDILAEVARRLAIDKAIDFMPETATPFFDQLPEIMAAPPNVLIAGGLVKDTHLTLLSDGEHVRVAGGDSVVFQSGLRKASFSLGSKVPVNGNPDAAWVVEELRNGGISIMEESETLGGNATNIATALNRLRLECIHTPTIGTVTWYADVGETAAQDLQQSGIAIIRESDEAVRPVGRGTVVTVEGFSDRIIFSEKPEGSHTFDPDKIPHDVTHAPGIAIITSNGPGFAQEAREFMEYMRISEVPVAYLPGSSEMKALEEYLKNPEDKDLQEKWEAVYGIVQRSDLLFANRQEIEMLVSGFGMAPSGDTIELLRQMKAIHPPEGYKPKNLREFPIPKGPRVVAMTDGPNKAYVIDHEGTVFSAYPFPAAFKNAIGSGDAFAGGFIGAYASGSIIPECIKWGLANSASVIEHVGTTAGLLDQVGIEERIARHPEYQVQVLQAAESVMTFNS